MVAQSAKRDWLSQTECHTAHKASFYSDTLTIHTYHFKSAAVMLCDYE